MGTSLPLYPLDVNGVICGQSDGIFGFVSGSSGGVFITKTSTYGLPSIQAVTATFNPDNLWINPVRLNVGVCGMSTPTASLDIQDGAGYNSLRVRTPYTPANSAGNTGDIAWDDNYVYVKTSIGWKRNALSAF